MGAGDPATAYVAIIQNPNNPSLAGYVSVIEAAALRMGIRAAAARVRDVAEIKGSIDQSAAQPNAALVVLPDGLTIGHRELIVGLAARHRMPGMYPERMFASIGGLISYAYDAAAQFGEAAAYVDRILKGATPAELPVQAPTKFALSINLKTAKALGLEVPPTLLARADEVIE
jgi:ABC-type uncharacterized transport system substrate-binding protein